MSSCLQWSTLPLRMMLYTFYMLIFSVIFLPVTSLRAIYRRCFVGKATDLNGVENHVKGPAQGYACQIVLTKPISNVLLFQNVVVELAKECQIDSKYVQVIFEKEKPHGDFPTEKSIKADHYVVKNQSFIDSVDVMGANRAKNLALLIRVWNNDEDKPSVLHCGLPGANWDGTSCFNFTKEMLHRYSNPKLKKNNIYKLGSLKINSKVKESLDGSSFLYYLLVQSPYAVLFNTHAMCWRFVTAPKCFGGPGLSLQPNVELLNFSVEQSNEITIAAKILNVKPFAALVHSAVTAHNKVMGERARRVITQVSMQTRAYEPLIKERNIIGDWLVGPVQRLDTSLPYTLEKSQEEYNNLISELTHFPSTGEVAQSFNAKAYGFMNHGAAAFEFFPVYGYDVGLFGPSIFFNNYGLRTMDNESNVFTWNWAAPFYLGCNCINVNGKTCIVLSTSFIGGENLIKIRDQMEININNLIQKSKMK